MDHARNASSTVRNVACVHSGADAQPLAGGKDDL